MLPNLAQKHFNNILIILKGIRHAAVQQHELVTHGSKEAPTTMCPAVGTQHCEKNLTFNQRQILSQNTNSTVTHKPKYPFWKKNQNIRFWFNREKNFSYTVLLLYPTLIPLKIIHLPYFLRILINRAGGESTKTISDVNRFFSCDDTWYRVYTLWDKQNSGFLSSTDEYVGNGIKKGLNTNNIKHK